MFKYHQFVNQLIKSHTPFTDCYKFQSDVSSTRPTRDFIAGWVGSLGSIPINYRMSTRHSTRHGNNSSHIWIQWMFNQIQDVSNVFPGTYKVNTALISYLKLLSGRCLRNVQASRPCITSSRCCSG